MKFEGTKGRVVVKKGTYEHTIYVGGKRVCQVKYYGGPEFNDATPEEANANAELIKQAFKNAQKRK